MSHRPEVAFARRRNNRRPLGVGALTAIVIGVVTAVVVSMRGEEVAAPTAGEGIVAREVWMRPAPEGGSTAAYMILANEGAAEERLLGVAFADAERVEIHETVMTDDIARMEPRPDGLVLPAGTETALAPMGKHVMIVDLARPLEVGATETLVLRFAQAGEVTVDAVVQLGP